MTTEATKTLVINEIKTKNQRHSTESTTKLTLKSKRDISKEPLLKDQEHKWFFEKFKLRPLSIILQIVFLGVAIHGIFNFPFLQHYKTIVWGNYLD